MTIRVTTLPNGLRVATDTMHEAESVVIGAWVGVGTRHEPWDANGVAHLVEHMMFKGTRKRSAYAISAQIEKNGGMMNAHTAREETAYYAKVLPEDTALAAEIIADMLQHSAFKPKELAREKQVIIQEIGRDLDSPEACVDDLMYAVAFPKQKIGRPILGSVKTIQELPRRDVQDYVRSHYHAQNMVIVGAGKIEHETLVDLAKKYFGKLPRGRVPKEKKAKITSDGKRTAKKIEQLHLLFGFPGPGFHNREIYATQILSILLGGSSASRLFQKIREKRGLVYSIHSMHTSFSDAGIFQIYAGTDPARAGELIPVVCAELRDVMKHVTPGELARAKSQARASMLMGQEDVMRRADIIGHHILAFGRPIPIAENLRKLTAVTRKDVQAMAKKLFSQKPILAAIGPLNELEDYAGIVKRLKG